MTEKVSTKSPAQNAFWYMVAKVIGAGVGFINTLLFARLMGAKDYGMLALVLALANLGATVAALGIPFLITREIAIYKERAAFSAVRRIARNSQLIAVIASGTVILAMGVLYESTDKFRGIALLAPIPIKLVALGVIATPILSINQIRAGILRGLNRVIAADFPEIILRPAVVLSTVGSAIILSISVNAFTGFAIILLSIIGAAILGFYLLGTSLRPLRAEPKDTEVLPETSSVRHMLAESRHFIVITLLAMMDGQISIYVIGALMGPREVGIYQVALQPVNIILMGLTAASISIQPIVAASWSKRNIVAARTAVQRAARFSAAMALACGVFLALTAEFIARLYGTEFHMAGLLLRILVVGQVVNGLTGPMGAVLMMTGNQQKLFYFDLSFILLKVLAIAVGIHYWGLVGAAIGEVSYLAAMRLSGVVFTYRQTGIITMIWRARSEF